MSVPLNVGGMMQIIGKYYTVNSMSFFFYRFFLSIKTAIPINAKVTAATVT